MITIDARGLDCPRPVMMAEEELNGIDAGTVDLLVDNEASAENLEMFSRKNGFYSETSRENNFWRVKISKGIEDRTPSKQPGGQAEHPPNNRRASGTQTDEERTQNTEYSCLGRPAEAGAQTAEETKPKKEILLIIGTDTMGREEEIGKILMKGFFETMKITKEIPDMLFFLNAGVKLTTNNEEIVLILKEIEAMGVEIFSCGTCLKYYGLESGLKVGYRGTTNHIIEGMIDYKKVVWI